jgi:hypothetical protein
MVSPSITDATPATSAGKSYDVRLLAALSDVLDPGAVG